MSNYLQNSVDLNISLSGVFSNSHFESVINTQTSSFIDKKIAKYKDQFEIESGLSRKDVLDLFYAYLLSSYRCEYVYKNSITKKILLGRHSLNTSTLINEFRVGSSIADCVLINGSSTLYEIKTELDSPNRLMDQLIDYQKAFTTIYLVVHYSEIEKYQPVIENSSVGLLALSKRFQLSVVKEALKDATHLDITTMFKSLRKKEYSNIILNAFGKVPDIPNMFYFRECLKLAQQMKALNFNKLMSQELKKRKPQEKHVLNSDKLPEYLTNICLSIDPNVEEYERLFSFLNKKIT
mgnify:CR=1 FL=1